MSIVVRLLEKGEAALANNFFNAIYKANRSLNDFEWEFISGPAGPAIYIIAVDSSVTDQIKVVGIQCAIPIGFVDSKGNRELSAKSEDTLVDPAYRGQKIFERMYDLLFEECKKAGILYIWGFTPAKKAFERIGFDIPFQAHQALMVFNPIKAYRYLSKLNASNGMTDKARIAGLATMSWLSAPKPISKNTARLVLKQVTFEAKGPTLETLVPFSPYVYLEMNSTYLSWRLDKNPFQNQYENYQCYQGDKVVADIILNFRQGRLGYIEQIIFDEQLTSPVRKEIVSMIVSHMKERVDFIRVLCFDMNQELLDQEGVFKQCGFVVLKRGAHFVWKSLSAGRVEAKELFVSRLFTQGNQ